MAQPSQNQQDQREYQDYKDYQDYQAYQKSQSDTAASAPGFLEKTGRKIVNDLPMYGGIVGGVLGTPADAIAGPMGNVVGAGIGGYLGGAAKNAINHYIDPANAPQNMGESLSQPVTEGLKYAAAEGAGLLASPYISKGLEAIAAPIKSFAAKRAIAATGATGVQASKFAPNAGEELLKQGVVGFGKSQSGIAKKATDALSKSGKQIGDALSQLDQRGAQLDQGEVINSIRRRAAELGDDPSQFGVADQLNKLADRIQNLIESKGGDSLIPLTQGEATKRGFQTASNYNLASPMETTVSKEAASIYQKAVEEAATKFDPSVAGIFKSAKKNYALLNPVEEAAAKRASTTNQSPAGGLLDMSSIYAGGTVGGPVGAIAAPVARRLLAPRIPATLAASANALGSAPGLLVPAIPPLIQTQVPNYSTIPGKNGH